MKAFLPSEALAPYIEAYYLSADAQPATRTTRYSAISISCIKLSTTTAVVSGQATRPTVLDAVFGDLSGLGVKLRPGAFHALFGIPASELTNQAIGLDEVLGRAAIELIEQLAEEANPADQVRCLERTLLSCVRPDRQPDDLIDQRLVKAVQKLPAMPIAQLAEELGYSARQLQRKLNDIIGLSPRLYQRLCRFEKALEFIRVSSGSEKIGWATIALNSGYSDQSHFIRDFHEFAGCTPGHYLASSYVN